MNKEYEYNKQKIDYHVIYKKRKSLGIYIDVYGNIELRVPRETSDEQISQMIEAKWNWIISKQKEMKEKTKGFKEKEYVEGEVFLYLGKSYPIKIQEVQFIKNESVVLLEEELVISIKEYDNNKDKEERIKKLLKKFYYQRCKALVNERITYYQPNFRVKPRGFKIANNKKTWGTCNSMRELTFNWKLAMAPIEVLDYVVVHEMCHMVHLNHDRSFWRLVGKYIPDYEDRQLWLRHSHWKMVV